MEIIKWIIGLLFIAVEVAFIYWIGRMGVDAGIKFNAADVEVRVRAEYAPLVKAAEGLVKGADIAGVMACDGCSELVDDLRAALDNLKK